MKRIKQVVFAMVAIVALAIAGVSIAAAFQPNDYTVSRTRRIDASPAEVAPQLTDLREWNAWSPWMEYERTARIEYSPGEPVGVGAWYTWHGDETGAGRMEIVEASDAEVRYALHFDEPFEDDAVVVMQMAAAGDGTDVTWRMDGHNNFIGKVFGLFVDMDAMVGADFERGLENLDERLNAAD
ncbi:MAG: SRPBCC family protein [Sandaracinaceae bacterium]